MRRSSPTAPMTTWPDRPERFTITVGQRTRELALLRLVGAGRRQVFRSVLGEAALTGLVASLVGLGLGVAAALGLKALLKAFGITLPSAPLVFAARTPLIAIAVGVLVTVISAIIPARRAVRIAPVAALSDHSADVPEALRRWRIRGRRRRRHRHRGVGEAGGGAGGRGRPGRLCGGGHARSSRRPPTLERSGTATGLPAGDPGTARP